MKNRLKHGQQSTITDKKNQIHQLIQQFAVESNWKPIQTKSNQMLSFLQLNQRINVWIKKNMTVTIRIQPMEQTKKDINLVSLKEELEKINDIILESVQFQNEGQ